MKRITKLEEISEALIDIILLDEDEVEPFINDENEKEFFENNEIKISCEFSKISNSRIQDQGGKGNDHSQRETSRKCLSWGLFMLAGMDFKETYNPFGSLGSPTHSINDSSKQQDSIISGLSLESPSHSETKLDSHNFTQKGLRQDLENLLKCRYVIEINSEQINPCNEKRAMSRTSATSRGNVLKSSKLNVEHEVTFGAKSKRINDRHEKRKPKRVQLTFNFFHLVILWRRKCEKSDTPMILLLFRIMTKMCQKDIDNESIDEWKHLKIAFSETIQSEDTNMYLNGMNAIHLACFCQ